MTDVLMVTGSSRGIGAATARLAARKRYDVVINYRHRLDAPQQVVADVGSEAAALERQVNLRRFPSPIRRLDGPVEYVFAPSAFIVFICGSLALLHQPPQFRQLPLQVGDFDLERLHGGLQTCDHVAARFVQGWRRRRGLHRKRAG